MSTIKEAKTELARRLIALVRFENEPSIRLDESIFPENDSVAIRKATALYIETWVVPYLWALAHDACTFYERGLIDWRKFEQIERVPPSKDGL